MEPQVTISLSEYDELLAARLKAAVGPATTNLRDQGPMGRRTLVVNIPIDVSDLSVCRLRGGPQEAFQKLAQDFVKQVATEIEKAWREATACRIQ